jgi:tRNA pseudouridine13 synthase
VLSAARAVIFNAVLAARVSAGSWHRLLPGDLANLDGRGSVFAVDRLDATLEHRCRELAIHPSGPLWGAGASQAGGEVAQLEERTAAAYPDECRACTRAGMRQERRSLRLAVRELRVEQEPQALVLHFRLTRGSFATAVLRELIDAGAEFPEG